jgi:ketosteroid isomerase-like protein
MAPADNSSPPTTPPEIQTEPPFQEAQVFASVEQLMTDRQTGGISAAQKYLGKVVEVQGIVDTADSTGRSPSISFKATALCAIPGGNDVDCFWMAERERSAVAKLHPGDTVIVLGRFGESGRYDMPSGYDIPGCAYYIHLRNCTVKGLTQNLSPPETAVPNEESAPFTQAQPSQPQTIQPDRSVDNQASASEQSVRDAVGAWVQAFRSKDSTALADSYAPVVERYFRRNNVSREQIRQYLGPAFAKMVDIREYEVNDLRVGMLPGDNSSIAISYSRATATFRKTWDTLESDGKSFSGEEIEQLTFINSPQGWKIIREEELKILRVSRH